MTFIGDKWSYRFLNLAETVSTWSKDPSAKVGAVLADDRKRVIAMGYNGFPDRIVDDEKLLADRDRKLQLVIHAELNAILNSPILTLGLHLFVTQPCCDNCAKHVVQAGIKTVSWVEPKADFSERWKPSIETAKETFKLAGVTVYEYPRSVYENPNLWGPTMGGQTADVPVPK